jgi:hypothetical protein
LTNPNPLLQGGDSAEAGDCETELTEAADTSIHKVSELAPS